jgi:hypothetical protein
MVNPEVVCHPYMAKTIVIHANSLPPFWYGGVCKVPRVLFNICVCERKLIFLCRVLSLIFYWFGMVRRKLTIPERWQAVGMHNGGFSETSQVVLNFCRTVYI